MPTKLTPEKKQKNAKERYKGLKVQKSKKNERSAEQRRDKRDNLRIQPQSQLVINHYQDYWMDNAVENLHHLVTTVHKTDPTVVSSVLEHDKLRISINNADKFLRYMQQLVSSKRDSVLFSESSGEGKPKKNVKLGYILIQYAKSSNGRNSVKEKIYSEEEMLARLSAGFLSKPGNKLCVLCGSSYEKGIDYLKQSILPSVTRNAALSGTLSKSDYFRSICPTCYMLGALEWIDDRVIYRSQLDDESIALYPIATDLTLLSEEKQIGYSCLSARTFWSNLQIHSSEGKNVNIEGPYSALLLFLESIVQSHTRRQGSLFDPNSREFSSLGQWMCLRVPGGTIKNVKIDSIELPRRILQIVGEVDDASDDDALRIYSELFTNFILESDRQSKSQNLWKEVGELRERLATYFIRYDYHAFASLFLRRKGVNIYLRYDKWDRLDVF